MSKWAILITPRAKKEIDRLQPEIIEKIGFALQELSINPYFGKPLQANYKGLYSYRVGSYRIVYDILNHQLVIRVIKVMHRRDVYR